MGRLSHATSMTNFRKPYKHVDLKDGAALHRGSEILSEGLVLSVAVAVAVYEFEKSQQKKAASEEKLEAAKAKHVADLEARLSRIENGLASLETALRERPSGGGSAWSWLRGGR